MAMQVTVEAIKRNPKSLVLKTSEGDFFAKLDQKMDDTVGKTIDLEYDNQPYEGKAYRWVKGWIYVASKAPQLQHPETGKTPTYPASTQPPSYQPFASNVVACAINTGLIKEPSQIKAWVDAVKAAI